MRAIQTIPKPSFNLSRSLRNSRSSAKWSIRKRPADNTNELNWWMSCAKMGPGFQLMGLKRFWAFLRDSRGPSPDQLTGWLPYLSSTRALESSVKTYSIQDGTVRSGLVSQTVFDNNSCITSHTLNWHTNVAFLSDNIFIKWSHR